jgi:hypothetical protein
MNIRFDRDSYSLSSGLIFLLKYKCLFAKRNTKSIPSLNGMVDTNHDINFPPDLRKNKRVNWNRPTSPHSLNIFKSHSDPVLVWRERATASWLWSQRVDSDPRHHGASLGATLWISTVWDNKGKNVNIIYFFIIITRLCIHRNTTNVNTNLSLK